MFKYPKMAKKFKKGQNKPKTITYAKRGKYWMKLYKWNKKGKQFFKWSNRAKNAKRAKIILEMPIEPEGIKKDTWD